MRKIRYHSPFGLSEITVRTFQNRPLLPPIPEAVDLILGVLGRAQRTYGLAIHAVVFLSTHYHLLVTATDSAQLASFMGYVNSNIAREIGRLIGWTDKFWGRRYEAIPISDEESAQVARLHYVLAHGVKEGLVVRPEDWPGVQSWQALLGEVPLSGTWHDRTREYEARRARKSLKNEDFSQSEQVVLTPLPCWSGLDSAVLRKRLMDLHRCIVEDGEALRRASGRSPLRPEELAAVDPAVRPQTVKRSPAPRIHAASRSVREAFRRAYLDFTVAFRAAAEALRTGDRNAAFPPGSCPPHLPWVPLEAT